MAQENITAIIGVGGMGISIARHIANGRRLFLADFSDEALGTAATSLRQDGYEVYTHKVDVADYQSVLEFAEVVKSSGRLEALVHTAGLSSTQASAKRIFEVDLLGTANVIEAFYTLASPGMSTVCISSMAAYVAPTMSQDLEQHLATAPLSGLLDHPEIESSQAAHSYAIAKRGNILRVQASAKPWGLKGARINTVSPGVISTAMAQHELKGEYKEHMDNIIRTSAAAKKGTPQDIANAVAFLLSPASSFISGNDILVDGGAVAGLRWGRDRS